jgi:hypothetical protein
MPNRVSFVAASAFSCLFVAEAAASAQESTPAPVRSSEPVQPPAAPAAPSAVFPRVGGHLGFAVPIVSVADPVTAIGADFVAIGLTPGITVKLSERWAVDFEFIALNELKNTPAATTYVVDPGVVYAAGPISAGLRVATQVGAPTNVGLVPIVVLPIKIGDSLTYYVEGDVPMFLRDGGSEMKPSVGFQFQSGIAF